ncbi:helix-turn-helix domain-containing protein [Streptomyces sp. NPDC102340]|uniref:helix-turn-helix domain-containing protein n=1 Tax=unclassified Streptomyces TaxID=2593676 RepID=UPI00382A419D
MTEQATPPPADESEDSSPPPPPALELEQLLSLTPRLARSTAPDPVRRRTSSPSGTSDALRAAEAPTAPTSTGTSTDPATGHRDERAAPAQELRLFTAVQAAGLLQIPASWLRKKAAAGQIAHTRIGRHLRFSSTDLQQLIKNGGRTPGRPPR